MDKIINMKTPILLIELATRTHSYFIPSMKCDTFIQMCHSITMLSTDGMSISEGLLNAHLLPCHFQIRPSLIIVHHFVY